jgi:RNA-directed DNA polymerase
MNGETLQTHHKTPLKDGGTDQVENLVHLHQACHQQMHLRMNRSTLPKA